MMFPEILIRPENPVSKAIARIGIAGELVTVVYPEKTDGFKAVVKGLGYRWTDGCWQKTAGKPAHAAAELGYKLLAAGFWIAPPTTEIKELIVTEAFEPEIRRKVMARVKGQYAGWLVLWWTWSENCYNEARKISGSRYDKPVVVVPPEFYDEVEDFAARYNFAITPAAKQLIAQARVALTSALLLTVEEDNLPDLQLPAIVEIDDELADHD